MKITKAQIAVLLAFSLLIPAIASADQCTEFMANVIQTIMDRVKGQRQGTGYSNTLFEKTIPQITETLGQPQVSNHDGGYSEYKWVRKPQVSNHDGGYSEYKWVCQSDGKSTLVVYSKDGNQIFSYGVIDDKGGKHSSARVEW